MTILHYLIVQKFNAATNVAVNYSLTLDQLAMVLEIDQCHLIDG